MEPSGKLIYTHNTDILSANLQTVGDVNTPEGQPIPISTCEIGSTEIHATSLQHSPNGRFITVIGDGKYMYIIYTPLLHDETKHSALAPHLRGQMIGRRTPFWMGRRKSTYSKTLKGG
jgi:hypothetical protein